MAEIPFTISKPAQIIIGAIMETKPNEMLTYNKLSNITGVNDINKLRGYCYTAFRHALKKWEMRFKNVPRTGYVRLDESDKNEETGFDIKKIRRRTKRAMRLHDAVSFHALDALGKLAHVTNSTQLAEMKKAASRGRRNKIATVASENKTVEAVIDGTLEMFKRKRA